MQIKLTKNERLQSFEDREVILTNRAYLYDLIFDAVFCILGPLALYVVSLQQSDGNVVAYALIIIFWLIYTFSAYRDLRRHRKNLVIEFDISSLKFGSKRIKFSKLLFPTDRRTFWLKVFDYRNDKEVLNVKLTKSAYEGILAYYYGKSG